MRTLTSLVAAVTLIFCACTNANRSTVDTAPKTTEEKENEIYLKIMGDIFHTSYGDSVETEMNYFGDKIIVYVCLDPNLLTLKYRIKKNVKDISFELVSAYSRGYPREIRIHEEGSTYLVNMYTSMGFGDNVYYAKRLHKEELKNIMYDLHGNRITLSDQIKENETRLLSILKPVSMIKDNDKSIFAAILSSKLMDNVEYLENEDYLEVFCENDGASYRFMMKPSTEGGYWGIINKMKGSADLQTKESDGSSEIYAFKIRDKSTSTKRFMISLVRVVQDIDAEYNQKKYGETSNTHHVVNDYVTVRSGGLFSGGAAIMATSEDSFTKTYLSEISENIIYTYDDGQLKLNGQNAYAGKFNKL